MTQLQRSSLLAALLTVALVSPGRAQQQVHVSTPLIGISDSYYEHFGVGWGWRQAGPRGGWFMNFGSPQSVIPPFGGYDPNQDFRVGFGGRNFQFSLAASQGSNRTLTMAAPSLTMMNGARGQIFSGSIRPFVTGVIPVVGGYPVVPYPAYPAYPPGVASPYAAYSPPVFHSPLVERIERLRHEGELRRAAGAKADGEDLLVLGEEAPPEPAAFLPAAGPSSAERGDISLAEIRRLQASEDAERQRELDRLIETARAAERAGELGVARVHYQQAAARASGEQRKELLAALAKLKLQR
jgi:hypothetical protein